MNSRENKSAKNIYSLLDHIEQRPAMYIQDESLKELQSLIWGYYAALRMHGLSENVPSMDRHFMQWIHYRTDWSSCAGWAYEIEQAVSDDEKPIDLFFYFVNQYKKIKPTLKSFVKLGPHHNPTGKRVITGIDILMEKPISIEIFKYEPEPLHFLKFHYEDRIETDDLLEIGIGNFRTTINDGKTWVHDEFQVNFDEWQDQ